MRLIYIILGILALAFTGKPAYSQTQGDSIRIIYKNKTVTVKPEGDESYTTVKFRDTVNNKKVVVKVMVTDNKYPDGSDPKASDTLNRKLHTKHVKISKKHDYGESRTKFIETDFGATLDIGFASAISGNNNASGYTPEFGRSANISIGLVRQNMNLYKGKMLLSYGIGINRYLLKYSDRQQIQYINPAGHLNTYRDSVNTYSTNRTDIQYISVPVLLEYHTKNNNFNVAAGVELGFNGKSKRVLKGRSAIDNMAFKNKSEANIKVNPVQVSAVVRIGIDRIAIFGKYNLSSMYTESAFAAGSNPDQHLFSVGICLFGI